ncbi:MAG: DUF1697 domain-containing protein [Gammaproteobacteria bacterium]|nr:DUF1697 domain-containing protein [Gammaproteobacteria bacterium]MDH5310076.1 DUF1697 domain-containing protein [Gammaproteobacteria bacterium]
MDSWIVLLRGINVGGKHSVPMRDLKSLMVDVGFRNVRTYIQSGNIVLESTTRPTEEISDLIEREFGFRPGVFILSREEFEKALSNNPYNADAGKTVHLFFCDRVPTSVDYDFLESIKASSEDFALVGRVFYFHAPNGIGRSILVQKMHRAFPGVVMTARNLNTINKLAQMLGNSRS